MLISATILLPMFALVFLSLALSLNFVQNTIAERASLLASEYIGAEVSIGNINVTLLGQIELRDFLARDLQQDTLLHVNSLRTPIVGISVSNKLIELGKSRVQGGQLNIIEREGGINIRQIINIISPGEGTNSVVKVDVEEAILRDFKVRIVRQQSLEPRYGVNYSDMQILIENSHAKNVIVDGSMIKADIEHVELSERSGFEVNDFKAKFYLTSGVLGFENMQITSRSSSVDIPYLSLVNASWSDYSEYIASTEMELEVSGGFVSSNDIAYFAPNLKNWNLRISDLDFVSSGTVDDLFVDIESLAFGYDTQLRAKLRLKGLPEIEKTEAEIQVEKLLSSANDIDLLAASILSKPLAREASRVVSSLGEVSIFGSAFGTLGNMQVDAKMTSALGQLESQMKIISDHLEDGGVALDGQIAVQNLDLGLLTQEALLEKATFKSSISGIAGASRNNLEFVSSIDSIQIAERQFKNIEIDARLIDEGLDGKIFCLDEAANFSLEGFARGIFNAESEKICNLKLDLKSLDLAQLKLNPHSRLSQIKSRMQLEARGTTIDDLFGKFEVRDLDYFYDTDTLKLDHLSLAINKSGRERRIVLKSPYAEGLLYTKEKLSRLFDYIQNSFSRFIPALYSKPWSEHARYNLSSFIQPSDAQTEDFFESEVSQSEASQSGATQNEAAQNEAAQSEEGVSSESLASNKEDAVQNSNSSTQSLLTLNLYDPDPVARAINQDLTLGDDMRLAVVADTELDIFNATLKTSFIERKSLLAIGLDMILSNKGDSLMLNAKAKELFVGTMLMNNASIVGGAKNNMIDLNAGFSNPSDSTSAIVGAMMSVERSLQDKPTLSMRLSPSLVRSRGQEWHLQSREMKIDGEGLHVDNLNLENESQQMNINGVASRSLKDSIKINMRNFDLSFLSSIIGRLGYRIDGKTNGKILAASVLDKARIEANVELDSVRVNNIVSPNMNLRAEWDTSENRARMFLLNRQSRDTLVQGYYVPSSVEYHARLLVDSVDMGLLDPPLGGVISQSEGLAKLDLQLNGSRRDAELSGTIHARNYSTMLDYTRVRYNMPEAIIKVSNNLLEAEKILVSDGQGGGGELDLRVDLEQLTNINYSLEMRPQEMLVLDTKSKDNDLFYGYLRASGLVRIDGDRSGVKMDINASSDEDSKFFMPLMGKTDISRADFITFKKPPPKDSLTLLAQKRLSFLNQGSSSSTPISISMDLDVQPNTEVQLIIDPTVGDIIKTKGTGKFNLTIEPKSKVFEIYGDYVIDEGSYLFTLSNIVNKKFIIDPGSSIQWAGSPMDATLSIDAIYKLKTSLDVLMDEADFSRAVPVDCIIRLRNSLSQPDVEFAIDLPTADSEQEAIIANLLNSQEAISRQFFYLMLSGNFIPENSGASANTIGVSATAATGFELLANQLSNWLSSSNYNVILRYRPESEMSSDEVDIGFSTSWIDNRLQIEVAGNYVADTQDNEVSNYMGEAHVTWLIDPQGALRLKGFTQTIDSYDENQGLQETGFGISYREDFENFRDLRRRVKERFARKEKEKKRKNKKNKDSASDIEKREDEEEGELNATQSGSTVDAEESKTDEKQDATQSALTE